MSFPNHNGQAASVAQPDAQSLSFINDSVKLETLIPKDLSSNKRAVIDRLVSLYRENSLDR
ncbi:MAG TPA: hypothetical protein VL134_14040 [Leptolyngbya sp.]|jgi:hypothetical protein|nr:hypothetical protein [Leptolyngbya sp.]